MMNRKGNTILTVGPAYDGAPVQQMLPEKHNVTIVVFDDTRIVNCSYWIRLVLSCQNGVFFKTFYDWIMRLHSGLPYGMIL